MIVPLEILGQLMRLIRCQSDSSRTCSQVTC